MADCRIRLFFHFIYKKQSLSVSFNLLTHRPLQSNVPTILCMRPLKKSAVHKAINVVI